MIDSSPGSRTSVVDMRRDLADIMLLTERIEQFTASQGIEGDVVMKLTLALEEIVTNVISYGFDPGDTPFIRVTLEFDGVQLIARVEDNGRPFDPLKAELPPFDVPTEERSIGGLGIRLVCAFMDDVRYAREQDRNVLVLQKTVDDATAAS